MNVKMLSNLGAFLLLVWIVFVTKGVSGRNISIVDDQFMLDGKPLQIISGSVHYFRMPSEYWRDRLLKAKAAGLNAVATYVEWSFHEPEERQYRFQGDYDLEKFVRTAAEVELLVLLRVGPYICAERDLGGFPYWLFSKYPDIKLRKNDKDFLAEAKTWLAKLFDVLKPLLYGNGGPVILVQVENEYGSFGSDKKYKMLLRDEFKKHVGSNALLYTADGANLGLLRGGNIPYVLPTINFGAGGNTEGNFKVLRKFMPKGPLMNSEFYTGWLTHWGERFSKGNTKAIVKGLDYMITHHRNVNMYMFYGGTNFEFSAGANTGFLPVITSYDYDSPLSEAGNLTEKYWAIRNLMIKHFPEVKNITPPASPKIGVYGKVTVGKGLNLLSPEGRSKLGKVYGVFAGDKLPTFEQLRQRGGLMLYETTLNKSSNGTLEIKDPRDRVYVFVNKEYTGLIDRETKQHELTLETNKESVLSLLCENQGRIGFNYFHDTKGIRQVKFNNTVVIDKWNVTGYPLQNIKATANEDSQGTEHGPVMYKGTFELPKGQEPLDTYLDTTGWGKGSVWVNGHNLGRYWPGRGPQRTLYVPGMWLRRGTNYLQALELEVPQQELAFNFIDRPIFNMTSYRTIFGRWHTSNVTGFYTAE